MSGITFQFANSPINAEINLLEVTASGTVRALATGSVDLMWKAKTNGGNLGEVRISTQNGQGNYFVLEAGDDTGWVPGNLQNYWWYGTATGSTVSLWRLR